MQQIIEKLQLLQCFCQKDVIIKNNLLYLHIEGDL